MPAGSFLVPQKQSPGCPVHDASDLPQLPVGPAGGCGADPPARGSESSGVLLLHGDKQCPSRPVKLRIKLPRAMRLHRPGAGGELPPLASRSHEKNRRMLGLLLVVVKNRIEQLEYIFAITLNSCIL